MDRETLLLSYYRAMSEALGPSSWWPGQTAFEIALGAILTQNTNWANVEKALANVRAHDALDPHVLRALPEARLAELIRPAGFFQVKARRVRNFLDFLDAHCALDLEQLKTWDLGVLREALLNVSGIGPETADSILLYALGHPSFVVDAYTRRLLNRHLLVPEDIDYAQLQDFFMDVLPADPRLFNEFHALIVRVGKTWCLKKAGLCTDCPLSIFLPQARP